MLLVLFFMEVDHSEKNQRSVYLPDTSFYAQGRCRSVRVVQEEIKKYKESLDKNKTKYKIVEETEQPDGSVIMKIIKQYNTAPVGSYLD